MAVSKSFLKKVYDKYESVDFQITDDNLNPLREISFYETFDIESLETTARLKLKEKIKEIKRSLLKDGLLGADDLHTANMGGTESNPKGKSLRDLLERQKVGTVGDSLFNLGNMSLDNIISADPLVNEIDNLMLSLLNPLYGQSTIEEVPGNLLEDKYNFDYNIDLFLPGFAPFGPTCETSKTGIDQGSGAINQKKDQGAQNDADFDQQEKGLNNKTSEDARRREKEAKAFLDGLREKENAQAQSLKQCALSSLGILKVIAIILAIIQVFRIIVTYVISILVQVAELVMLAAGIWINPTNIATIISKVIQMVIALLTQILAGVLQMLLDMINADCLVQSSLGQLNQINKAMTMGTKTIKNTKKAVSFTTDSYKAFIKKKKDAAESLDKTIKKAKDLKSHDWVGDVSGSSKKALLDGLQNGATMNIALLKRHGFTQDLLDTLRESANAIADLTATAGDLIGLSSEETQKNVEKINEAMANIDEVMSL